MIFLFLIKGFIVGFSLAMPVGPIGLLCIQNSITWGRKGGFMIGLGAAAADAIFGAIAGFGIVAGLTTFLIDYQYPLQIIGGLILCYLGVITFRKKEIIPKEDISQSLLTRTFFTSFFLTLTNPLTILTFFGIYVSLGIGLNGSTMKDAWFLTCGVFLGSLLWWIILSSSVAFFKKTVNPRLFCWFNRISGLCFLGFGIAALFARF